MMRLIETEGTEFYYDQGFEYKSFKEGSLIYNEDALNHVDKDVLSKICRPVLTKYLRPNKFFLDYLFWLDGTDLKIIDRVVENETYCDNVFHHAIKTQYIDEMICVNCSKPLGGALVESPDIVYPGNFSLRDSKQKIARKHLVQNCCPYCALFLR